MLIYLVNEKKRFHSVGIARSRLSKFDQNEFGEIWREKGCLKWNENTFFKLFQIR